MPPFTRFLAIDWTGARPGRTRPAPGVAVASCDADGRVELVPPPAGPLWGRAPLVDWLAGQARAGGGPILAGFDFAFGMPFHGDGAGYLHGRVPGVTSMTGLWAVVEAAAGDGADLFAGAAVADPRFAPSYWINGPTPPHWGDGSAYTRLTERAAAATGAGTPVSVFKLAAGAKQVGKGSLAGMRALHALRGRLGQAMRVWPADGLVPASAPLTVAEIYPTLFRLRTTGSNRKITGRAALSSAMAKLGATLADSVPEQLTDHDGDALISAAGLRWLAGRAETWSPAGLTAEVARTEGWIIGV